MNPIVHGIKEAYKQLGRSTFCCMFATLLYLAVSVFIGFAAPEKAIAGHLISSIFIYCAAVSGLLSILSFAAHYFNLFKVYIQNTSTGQELMIRHSSRHIEMSGWVVHRTDGPAISGFDLHNEEDFNLFYFEGAPIDPAVFEKIAFAKSKGDLNQFLTSPDEHHRNFAKYKMRSL